jgi:GntR family transcriptional regulator, transcriptional repressor for pyruvate dehydrogenase complex
MEDIQSHERVMNTLVGRIFSRQLKPGDKLPPERQLAREMQVDRASLRMGLKHLETMNVLTIRQGDGIYVRDYLKGASMDFLRILFIQADKPDSDWLVDPYILDEIWEFWVMFLPEMLKLAAKRYTARDLKVIMDIIEEELANLENLDLVIELELRSQDFVAEVANNIIVLLLSHTCRPLRKKMIEIFYTSIGTEGIKRHLEAKRNILHTFLVSSREESLDMIEQYRGLLDSYRQSLRKIIFQESGQSSDRGRKSNAGR